MPEFPKMIATTANKSYTCVMLCTSHSLDINNYILTVFFEGCNYSTKQTFESVIAASNMGNDWHNGFEQRFSLKKLRIQN